MQNVTGSFGAVCWIFFLGNGVALEYWLLKDKLYFDVMR